MKELLLKLAAIIWSHRMVYAGIAGVYGASCFGMEKELVNQMLTALYVLLVAQSDGRH